jgi:predicted MFS family arabinose efflux permease
MALDASSSTKRTTKTAWLVAALLLAVGCFQLNNTMIAPANPFIIKELHTDTATVGLAQTLFLLMSAISAIVVTRISDWTGRKRALLASLAVLVVGDIICALAPSVGIFLVGRTVGGLCGAVYAFAFLILKDVLNLGTFSRALAIIAAVKSGLGGFESVAGGAIVDSLGFRAIFWTMLGFTVLAAAVVHFAVPEVFTVARQRLDWLGCLVIAGGLTGISVALSQGGKWGWTSPLSLICLLGGVALLCLLPTVERRAKAPLMAPEELRSRQAWPVLTTNVLTLAGAFAATGFVLPLMAQNAAAGFGMSAVTASLLYVMPVSAVGFLFAPLAGWLAPRIGWRTILLTGMVVTIAALAVLAFASTSPTIAFAMAIVLGAFYTGMVLTSLDGLGVLLSSKTSPGALTGFNTAAFGIGASLGVALTGGIIAGMQVGGQPTHAGYTTALWACAALVFAGGLFSLLIPKKGVGAVQGEDTSAEAVPSTMK